jgi:hypothetical protein
MFELLWIVPKNESRQLSDGGVGEL